MPFPTWNGESAEGGPAMIEATTQAWEVLREAMGVTCLQDRSTEELLHGVEAAAWLDRAARAGRHLLVPAAKLSGASWAQLGAAMGVSRATAQHRHEQEVADWEEDLRLAAAPPPWEGVAPLVRTELPVDFEPTDDQFAKDPKMPAWMYTGPLGPAIQFVTATHDEVVVYRDGDAYCVSSTYGDGHRHLSTAADSEEEMWRGHLGHVLLEGEPFPDDARPGETIAGLKARTGAL